MKIFIKNSYLFLIFFILLFSKNFLYALFIPQKEINLENIYIQKLEKEINDIAIFNDYKYKISGIYGKVLYQNPLKPDEIYVLVNPSDIQKGAYVLDDKGLIGVVKSIEDNIATIELITSDNFYMQITINDCYGIYNGKERLISNISNYCKVLKNDKVYTSSLGMFDEKILIGTVDNILLNKNGLQNEYYLKPEANLNNLNYVVILKGGKKL